MLALQDPAAPYVLYVVSEQALRRLEEWVDSPFLALPTKSLRQPGARSSRTCVCIHDPVRTLPAGPGQRSGWCTSLFLQPHWVENWCTYRSCEPHGVRFRSPHARMAHCCFAVTCTLGVGHARSDPVDVPANVSARSPGEADVDRAGDCGVRYEEVVARMAVKPEAPAMLRMRVAEQPFAEFALVPMPLASAADRLAAAIADVTTRRMFVAELSVETLAAVPTPMSLAGALLWVVLYLVPVQSVVPVFELPDDIRATGWI